MYTMRCHSCNKTRRGMHDDSSTSAKNTTSGARPLMCATGHWVTAIFETFNRLTLYREPCRSSCLLSVGRCALRVWTPAERARFLKQKQE